MADDEPAKDAQITIRLPSALLDQLRAEAKADKRSVAFVVLEILEAHYSRRRK